MSVAVRPLILENEQDRMLTLLRQCCNSGQAAKLDLTAFSQLHAGIVELERSICALDEAPEITDSIFAALAPETIKRMNEVYRLWSTTLEHRFLRLLEKDRLSLSGFFLNGRYEDLTQRELALLAGCPLQRILVIGSGPLPISAIHIHLLTGLPVDCLAGSSEIVAFARQGLSRCRLSESIRVLTDDSEQYQVSDYDLIVIDQFANGRSTLLKKIRKQCQPGCQILFRNSHGLRRLLHEEISDRSLRGYHLKACRRAEGSQIVSTWLIEPALSAANHVKLEWLSDVDHSTATQLLRLINRTLEEETTIGYPGPLDEDTGRSLMQQLRADVSSRHRYVLVAKINGSIVGQLILTPNSSPNHRHMVELTRGTIHPSFRGGGLTLRAFHEVARKCEELGREVICLDVRAGTMAAIWWQHFGFKQYGLLEDYSRVGDKRYQGLYLTQTTADLKQRVADLSGVCPSAVLQWPGIA